jgi:hypothetical protein
MLFVQSKVIYVVFFTSDMTIDKEVSSGVGSHASIPITENQVWIWCFWVVIFFLSFMIVLNQNKCLPNKFVYYKNVVWVFFEFCWLFGF